MQQTNTLDNLRHTCAHLLAASILELYPGAKNAIGPSIEHGFYQDFDLGDQKISEEDFSKIEQKMRDKLKQWDDFSIGEVPVEQARKDFSWNPYKLELIEEFAQGGKMITETQQGDFLDLCKGGHVDHPKKEIKHFKLLSIAGAYWRGSEKNKMLTRIYGTCFSTKEELETHLTMLEEAKKRDHRKFGKELDLYVISPKVGGGFALLTPRGTIIRQQLEKLSREMHEKYGYLYVNTPNVGNLDLYRTSGHYPYYAETMFPPLKSEDGEEFMLRPMNCPHHIQIYDSQSRSYRDLPLRLREDGLCFRYEKSGEVSGLTRVRALTIDDAHIFCTQEQMEEEINRCIDLAEEMYKILGFSDIRYTFSLRDPNNKEKYVGSDENWEKAQAYLRQVLVKRGLEFIEYEGEAAFYGPKIDVKVRDALGREWQLATIPQVDYNMPERFDLNYVDAEGKKQRPVILHRAIYGSYERFMGILIEHYAGAFPVWLAPVQVHFAPVSQKHVAATEILAAECKDAGIRVDVDTADETVGNKVRKAAQQKVPYIIVVGDKELAGEEWSIRVRGVEEAVKKSKQAFLEQVQTEIRERKR